MKLKKLRLIAYGPFTDENLVFDEATNGSQQTIEFDTEPGLHLVFGANEAGKSSALRAIGDLLFGFPQQTADNFLHPNKNLRLGATLVHSNGEELAFVRRKANKSPLRDEADNAPLSDLALHPFIGDLNRTSFESMYGLNSSRLLEGSAEILRGKGELGSALFAAGSGIATATAVQRDLNGIVESLYKSKGKNPKLNKLLSELEDQRKQLKAAQLSVSFWEEQKGKLDEAQQKQAELDAVLDQCHTESTQLHRIQTALPTIAKRAEKQRQLSSLANAPALESEFLDRVIHTQNDAKSIEEELARLKEEEHNLEAELVTQGEPQMILTHADEIRRFNERLGSYLQAEADKQLLNTQRIALEQQVQDLLSELNVSTTFSEIKQLRISDPQQQRIQTLANAKQAKWQRRSDQEQAVSQKQRQVNLLCKNLQEYPRPLDISSIRSRLHNLKTPVQAQNRITELERVTKDLERELQQSFHQVSQNLSGKTMNLSKSEFAAELASEPMSRLLLIPVPNEASVREFSEKLNKCERDIESHQQRIQELAFELRQLETELEHLDQVGLIPSEADLQNSRQLREEFWQTIKRQLDGREIKPAEQKKLTSKAIQLLGMEDSNTIFDTTSQAYERLVLFADELSDRLRNDADRVAKKSEQLLRKLQLENKLNESRENLKGTEGALKQQNQAWLTLWQDWNLTPDSPQSMLQWIADWNSFRKLYGQWQQNQTEIETLHEQTVSAHQDLVSIAETLLETDPSTSDLVRSFTTAKPAKKPPGSSSASKRRVNVLDIWSAIDDSVQQITTRMERYESLASQVQTAEIELLEAQERLTRYQEDCETWQNDWTKTMQVLNLDADALPEEATATLRLRQSLLETYSKFEDLDQRIIGIDSDSSRFVSETEQFLSSLSVSSEEQTLPDRIRELARNLENAEVQTKSRERLRKQQGRLQERIEESQARQRANQVELSNLLSKAHVNDPSQLTSAAREGIRRQQLEHEIDALEEELFAIGGGKSVDEFVTWVTDQEPDPDRIPTRLNELGDQVEAAREKRDTLIREIAQGQQQLDELTQTSNVSELSFTYQESLTKVESTTRMWLVHRIAELLLNESLERYRDAQRGPVLNSASEYFARLTLGRYDALKVDLDDKGHPYLASQLAAGEKLVPVEGLSEGTRDQLFLALRFATLKQRMETTEPLPLIFDDLFASFDDERAKVGLAILAEISCQTQVIFFTHHRHLVEIAQSAVPPHLLHQLEL